MKRTPETFPGVTFVYGDRIFHNMEGKATSAEVKDEELFEVEQTLNYELEVTPVNSSLENKTGITFKGSNEDYFDAHGKILELMNEKGERYLINGIEIAIADNPQNKPIIVEVKPRVGLTGKANLKIYNKNGRGSATILLTKAKGSKMLHVRTLGILVIKYMLDGIISGDLETKDIVRLKSKVAKKILDRGEVCEKEIRINTDRNKHMQAHGRENLSNCTDCEKIFPTVQKLASHKKKVHNTVGPIRCGKCSKMFKKISDLEEHSKINHESTKPPASKKIKISDISSGNGRDTLQEVEDKIAISDEFNEELNEKKETYLEELEKKSFEERRMSHREIEVQINEEEVENMGELEENEKNKKLVEKINIKNELEQRSKMNDEKVLLKQKKMDEEVQKQIKDKQVSEAEKILEERKRKRQKSLQKKKLKKKAQQERNQEIQELESHMIKDFEKNLVEIDEKYTSILLEAGINRKDFIVYKSKADGACASNCTAIHVHHEQNLGPYVRRNVNEYIVQFWPFFKAYYKFPHTQMVGPKLKSFLNEEEFLNFLRKDPTSGWMWMDHIDLQVVANLYQMRIHILTTNISNMEEPKARWTHLVPDERLQEFRKMNVDSLDMFLLHYSDVHYDLIVHKESILATEGDINERRIRKEKESESEINVEKEEESGEFGPGYMGWRMNENEKVSPKQTRLQNTENMFICVECDKIFGTTEELTKHKRLSHDAKRPVNCKSCGKTVTNQEDREKHMKVCHEELMKSKEYLELKKEFEDLKVEYEKLKIAYNELVNKVGDKDGEDSNLKKLKAEVKKLKNDYKIMNEAIQKETLERNKAETKLKVLKDTVSAKEKLETYKAKEAEKVKDVEENDDSSMVVDDEVWEEPRRRNRKRKNSLTSQSWSFCKKCEQTFSTQDQLKKHERSHTQEESSVCSVSENKFKTMNELGVHEKSHEPEKVKQRYSCNICGHNLETQAKLWEHKKDHTSISSENKRVKCNKCEKDYSNMSKLRRHDWRAHREIDCNICDEKLKSREEIKDHRQIKHRMPRKIACKFFPDCIDEDECLYSHEELEKTKNVCADGDMCLNQSCEFSEANHLKSKSILCKFQENCNRINCTYKHTTERKAFLGVSWLNKDVN